jgi:gluconolactonase
MKTKILQACILTLALGLAACSRLPLRANLAAASASLPAASLQALQTAAAGGTLTADACLNQTSGEPECKDCCDTLDGDAAARKACRDACPGHNFSQNTELLSIQVTSILGPNGDYSACTASGSQGPCKDCCDGSSTLQGGDRRFCRDACNKLPDLKGTGQQPAGQPPAGGPHTQGTPQPTPSQSFAPLAMVSQAQALPISGTYQFTEGPAVDGQGSVYFSDINAGRIYKWSSDGSVSLFLDGLNAPNGLAFTQDGDLIACEGGSGRIISIDAAGKITPLVEKYNGLRFNEPNDLWIDPLGGIYFTDPVYQQQQVQDSQAVYYLQPDHSQVLRVISDLTRPNGIVGTPDGKTLFVADHGAGQTFAYSIQPGGTLTGKRLFVSQGSDGMELDTAGNLYLTSGSAVQVYDSTGKLLREISLPQPPTNVAFAGSDRSILFITARTQAYTLQMSSAAAAPATTPSASAPTSSSSFRLTSPEVSEAGLLPMEYTCDGDSSTLALSWSGAPAGTVSYAVVMHHVAGPGDTHVYWVVYDIPASATNLDKNSRGVGTLGINTVNGKTEYSPPCSKGPGPKVYTYTVYALSALPQMSVPAAQVTREILLQAIQGITLGSAELQVTYSRK